MRLTVRPIAVALLAITAILCALASTTQSVYALAAATYILPGLFNYPFIHQADIDLATPYITDITGTAPPTPLVVMDHPAVPPTPDSIEPASVIFGYSDGANTATTYKESFNQFWASNPAGAPDLTLVLIGNPYRPNGGNAARQNLGATPTETAGAAAGDITTYDIARQYDDMADYPTNPLNLLAVANASMGFVLTHMDYSSVNMSQAVLQGTYGDTAYYLIPTYPLPLLMPLAAIPGVGPVIADTMDPPLRVLVEAGYDRKINPGVPTPFNTLYFPDPTALANNFDLAITTGWDNGLEDLGMDRPFGTVRPDIFGQGAYGIGGPPVTLDPTIDSRQQVTIMAAPNQSPIGPSQPPNSSDGTVASTSAAAQQESSPPPPDTPTEPAASSTANTSVLTDLITDANQRTPQPNMREQIGSNPTVLKAIRPSNDGLLKNTLDALTSPLQRKASQPSGSASTASGDTSERGRHSKGAE